jgi:peptidoglycan hydrolase-like protein with peptidoglycan-binding domain
MDHARRRPAAPTPAAPEQAPAPSRVAAILELQRTAGNAALAQLLSSTGPQRQAEDTLTEPGLETEAAPTDAEAEEAPATTDPASKPMIRYGSRGEAVTEAQLLLNGHGAAPPLAPDGIFGPLTRAATIAFQGSHGLVPDGIIGPLTWGALLAPIPGPELFSLGDEGPDVGLLEQRLNAAGMAQPPLPIDATYDIAVLMAVVRFQIEVMGAAPTGIVDQATWDALEVAAPGGGLDAAGFEEHVASVDAEPRGEQVAGTSLHQPVGPGGLLSGPAVEEFQQKINIVRLVEGLDPIVEDGAWGTAVADATTAYQATEGIPESGVGDLVTWDHLDVDAPATTVGFVNREWRQDQGGSITGLTGDSASRYSWRIAGNQILCSAKVDFRNNPPSPDWFGFVTAAWNIYKAVSDTSDEVLIDFELTQGAGGDANVVDVKTGSGRANAGEWFLTDDDAANTIPHEYGHLIGLRDEYQVHPGDYREITGNEPPVGESGAPADGSTPEQVAQEVQDAILARDSVAVLAATTGRGIAMGAWAQRVVAAYAVLPPVDVPAKPPPGPKPAFTTSQTDIAHDLDDSMGVAAYEAIQVLTYTSGSLMGDPSRVHDPHDHGVQPRHVQEFADRVAAARGGTWTVQPR